MGARLPSMGCLRFGPKLAALAVLCACAAASREAAAVAPDFVPLFNGQDLTGWVAVNCASDTWSVEDNMIVCSGKPTGVLRTDRMYRNFIAEFEYRHMTSGGNAGFFVWSDPIPARGVPFTRSVEVQVIDGWETDNWTSHGDVFSIHGASLTPDRAHPAGWQRCLPSERRAKGTGEWNHFRITATDGTLKLAVNGKEVSGGHDIRPRMGYLCLESEGSLVHFRNLRIKELPAAQPLAAELVAEEARGFVSLYNGRDLSGWDAQPEHEGHWVAQDWRLAHDGESSDLWSEAQYGDFELIVDWRWTADPRQAELPVLQKDGSPLLDGDGQPVTQSVADAGDSGIYLRGSSKNQVNIWCWPIGSGEVYGYRTDAAMPASVRAGVTPTESADAPIGQWNRFEIRMLGERLTVVLNEKRVLDRAQLPGVAARGRLALQSHGAPLEFANLFVRELD